MYVNTILVNFGLLFSKFTFEIRKLVDLLSSTVFVIWYIYVKSPMLPESIDFCYVIHKIVNYFPN